MLFSPENDPGKFEQAVDVILASEKSQTDLVYLNDIVIFYWTPDEHITSVKQELLPTNVNGYG